MKLITFLILAFLAFLQIAPLAAATFDKEALARIEKHFPDAIETLYNDYQLRGDFLVAVVDPQGLRYVYTLNSKGSKAGKNGLTIETPFLIASHTKALTGTLAQVLAQQGKFDLDAPLAHYLAGDIHDARIAMEAITIQQLLNHTAGFTSILHTFKTAFLGYENEDDLIAALNQDMLVASPGDFRYSNTGPILAARAMEKATGKSWQMLMKQELFEPLGMQHTSSKLSSYSASRILPSIEVASDGEVLRTSLYKTDQTLHASGGTVSTLSDMAKWLQFNLNRGQQLASADNFFTPLHEPTTSQDKRYFTYDRTGYSLAWDITDYHGKRLLTRFGGFGGISFHASFMPGEQVAVVAFFNEERGHLLPHLAANYLYNLVLSPTEAAARYAKESESFVYSFEHENASALQRDAQVQNNKSWQKLLGDYRADDGWPSLELFAKNGVVWLRWGVLTGPLFKTAESPDSFVAALGPLRRTITVSRDSTGSVQLKNGSIVYYAQFEREEQGNLAKLATQLQAVGRLNVQ